MTLVALVLAVMMTLALCGVAFATSGGTEPEAPAASTTKTITLTGGKAGHTYTLYQIFTGTVSNNELTNIQWGSDANAALKAAHSTAAAFAADIAELNDARATAQALVAGNFLGTGTALTLSADGNVEFTGLAEGYYMIIDTNNNTSVVEGDYNSAYVVKVVQDVSGAMKGSGTTSEKEVALKGTTTYQASASYDIGDAVPFKLTATTANNVAAYKKYHITFQDTQSTGLDAPTSFTVAVLGKTFTVPATGEDPASQTTDNGTKITVSKVALDASSTLTFAIKVEFEPTGTDAYLNAECNSTGITVDYTSVLNANAKIGSEGNLNTSNILYSNNPESTDGHEEGKTPDDTVKVFTFKPVVNKTDADGNPLAGAGFTIYQEVASGTEGAQTGSAIKTALGNTIEASALTDAKYYKAFTMTLVGTSQTQFEYKGLADGNYVLVETTIPDGFNPFQSVAFTITSTVKDDTPELLTLTGSTPFSAESLSGDLSGQLTANIQNNSGKELPSTGGIGTTIFYVAGIVLVLGAAAIIIARRKAEQN